MSKPKQPPYTAVDPDDQAYKLLYGLIEKHHSDLSEIKVALVWAHNIKPDRDGNLVWGQAKKVSPLEQQFHDHDAVIIINASVWQQLEPQHREALLDHEISHIGSVTDDDGECSYYIRKHTVEEFEEVIERHGLWRKSVRDAVEAAIRNAGSEREVLAPKT